MGSAVVVAAATDVGRGSKRQSVAFNIGNALFSSILLCMNCLIVQLDDDGCNYYCRSDIR